MTTDTRTRRTDPALALAVYRTKTWLAVLLASVVIAVYAVLLRHSPALVALLVMLWGFLVVAILKIVARRRVIITQDEVISIPRTGPEVHVPFDEITKLEAGVTSWAPLRYSIRVPAALLSLKDGRQVVIALEFRESDEILKKLGDLIAMHTSDKAPKVI
jgi:hypothetical protein